MKIKFLIILLFCGVSLFAQVRSFDEIFPNHASDIRAASFGNGYLQTGKVTNGFSFIGEAQGSRIDPQIIRNVLSKNPGYLVESITVIPESTGIINLLDVYNALGNIRNLAGMLYHSHTRNREIPLFEEATRIESEKKTTPIPDPAPSRSIPRSETMYIRLKDINFGNTYYRGDISLVQNGLSYTLTNNRNITYLFIPAIREENLTAQLYIEPIREGILIYSIAGIDIPDFFANRIHVESAIANRLAVINSWASEEISKEISKKIR